MASPRGEHVGIIGGGLGGLAAACTLAARGYEVTLLERNPWLGGKAAVLEEQGFRFDMGPTIVTLPSVLTRIFAEAQRQLSQYIELTRLDPQWRAFFPNGKTLDLHADVEDMAATIETFVPGQKVGEGYRHFLEYSQRLHAISQRYFFWRSVDSLRDTFAIRSTLSTTVLHDLMQMRPGRTVASTVRSYVHEPHVAQMLDHFTQYVGSAPAASPAVLCGIAHMQTDEGIWYPRGGTAAIPQGLERLARELGVKIRTATGVRRILLERGAVCGVETNVGEHLTFAALVSNADTIRTYRDLLPASYHQRLLRRRYEPSCSGVVLYLGLRKAYEHLLHHNFVFSHDPEKEFHTIYRGGEPAPDPTCYVCAPARTDPSVAPPGGEALYVLVHTPYLRDHHDWAHLFPTYRQVIFNKLQSTAGMEDLYDRIVYEYALTPFDIHQRYQVLNGAIYGLASHGRFLGAFKPGNRRSDVKGLYCAGGAAHPGPGIPMVLMSGWIAADALDQDGLEKSFTP